MADETPDTPTLQMNDIKTRADELGCYMQLFVAYNPHSEMLMVASNAPDASNAQETALLLALAADNTSDRLESAMAAAGLAPNVSVEGDDETPDTLN